MKKIFSLFALREKNTGKRRGSSLVEMLLAVLVLAIVLLGVLAGVTIARVSVDHKVYENAKELGLRVLEWAEGIPLSADFTGEADEAFPSRVIGDLSFEVTRVLNDPDETKATSADITVTVRRVSAPDRTLIPPMRREVSASGWQNIGELP